MLLEDFSHQDDDRQPDCAGRAKAVIAAVEKFSRRLPITVELSPYLNRYTKDVQGVVLTDLFAREPGNGVGSKVVQYMLRCADLADINIYTDAEGPRSAAFYEKMGFEYSQNSGHQFVHYPPLDIDNDD